MSAGIVGKVRAVATTSYPGACACWWRGVNVLFTVEVWTYNHAMGSSVLAQTIVNITQLDGGALRQRLDRLNNDVV